MTTRRLLPALTAAAVLGAPLCAFEAQADIYDVSAGAAGAYGEIVVEFDAPPTAASAAIRPDGVFIAARGVIARPRRIEAAGGGLVGAVDVREGEGGVELRVAVAAELATARAWIDDRAVHVLVTFADDGMNAAAVASRAEPAPDMATAGAHHADSADAATAEAHGAQTHEAAAEHHDPAQAAETNVAHAEASGAMHDAGHGEDAAETAPAETHVGEDVHDAAEGDAHAAPAAMAEADHDADPHAEAQVETGGETTAHAAAPSPSDGFGALDADALAHRDLSRPTVVFAGRLGAEDCRAAEDGVRVDPWDLDALRDYASCLALEGEAQAAITAFQRLLTFSPDDYEAQLGLAAARHEMGEVDAAAATYQRLLQDAIGDAEAARLRALMALSVSGDPAH
ncbi:MAG: tetratricopeptide repeat protein [Maricaulaceae bacterium]|jgi:tetratricopeptide (TPR) repeat protein